MLTEINFAIQDIFQNLLFCTVSLPILFLPCMVDRSRSGHFCSCILLSVLLQDDILSAFLSVFPRPQIPCPEAKSSPLRHMPVPVLVHPSSNPLCIHSFDTHIPYYSGSKTRQPFRKDLLYDSSYICLEKGVKYTSRANLSGSFDALKKVYYIPVKIINGFYIGPRFGEQDSPGTKKNGSR